MNNERLTVRNFAGIKELNVDFTKMMILFGHQAVGKGIILKLFYFFHKIKDYIIQHCREASNLDDLLDKEKINKYIAERFDQLFPVKYNNGSSEQIFEIEYSRGSDSIYSVKGAGGKSSFKDYGLIERIKNKYDDLIEYSDNSIEQMQDKSFTPDDNRRPADIIKKILDEMILKELIFFIPAGRSFFAAADVNNWNIRERELEGSLVNWDPVFIHFSAAYENIKGHYENAKLESEFLRSIFNSKYIRISGIDYLQEKDGRLVEVSRSSSGQQELLPLAIALEVLHTAKFPWSSMTLFIEEPEAHLFPDAQKQTVYEIAKVFNRLINHEYEGRKLDIKVLLSSHSPYVMTSFNNLIEGGNIIKENKEKTLEVNKIIQEDSSLEPGTVQAYFINDTCRNIIEEDDGLIDGELLDSVSNDILEEFDKLQGLYS